MGFLDVLKGAAGGIASGLFGLGSSAIGASSSNKQIDKQLAAQKEENQKNREYNLQLAQMQNAWNQEQWERENEYNSPVNQMKRFQEAGLNPDLMYQNGSSGNAMQLSGGMTAGAPSSPQDFSALGQKKSIGDVIAQSLNNEMMRAQIDKVKAETRSEGYQADILKSDASFRDAINQGNLDLGKAQISGISSDIMLNDSNIKKLRYECGKLEAETDNLIAEYDKIRASIVNLDANTALQRLHHTLDSKKAEAEIRKLASSTALDYANAKEVVTLLSAKLLGLEANNELVRLQGLNVKASTDRIEWDLDQDQSFKSVERKTNIVTDITDSLFPIAALIGTAFGGNSYEESYHETSIDKNGRVSEKYGSRKRK